MSISEIPYGAEPPRVCVLEKKIWTRRQAHKARLAREVGFHGKGDMLIAYGNRRIRALNQTLSSGSAPTSGTLSQVPRLDQRGRAAPVIPPSQERQTFMRATLLPSPSVASGSFTHTRCTETGPPRPAAREKRFPFILSLAEVRQILGRVRSPRYRVCLNNYLLQRPAAAGRHQSARRRHR